MDFIFSGEQRTYQDFKDHFSPLVVQLVDSLRDYCFSLGKNVVEDVRIHRLVYGKSTTFRSFVDIEPQKDSVLLKIRRDRKEPPKEMVVTPNQNLDEVKVFILDAYNKIH